MFFFFHVNPSLGLFFELKIFVELFEKFEWLRILNLSGSGIHKLSDSIENFKYLWCWFNCWKLWFGCYVSTSERDSDVMPSFLNEGFPTTFKQFVKQFIIIYMICMHFVFFFMTVLGFCLSPIRRCLFLYKKKSHSPNNDILTCSTIMKITIVWCSSWLNESLMKAT